MRAPHLAAMPLPEITLDLYGQAQLTLAGLRARPRFFQTIVAALLIEADEQGVVLDARRTVARLVDGADRWPERHRKRLARLDAELPGLYESIAKLRELSTDRNGRFHPLTYALSGGHALERTAYLRQVPPVCANVSRCLTALVRQGLADRWYSRDGLESDKPFRGAVVCVQLSPQLLCLRD